jgi:MFS family permease
MSTGAAESDTARIVLTTLAAGQFLVALDSSVMNVSIATVAHDVGIMVTGVQGAIAAYTLVMATVMVPGGKVGALFGRKRAFMIGRVIYGSGSLTTALAPNLTVLLLGILLLARRVTDARSAGRSRIDVVGAALCALGPGTFV